MQRHFVLQLESYDKEEKIISRTHYLNMEIRSYLSCTKINVYDFEPVKFHPLIVFSLYF